MQGDVAQGQWFGCPEAVGAECVWGMAVAVLWTWTASFQGVVCRSTWTFMLKQRAPVQGAKLGRDTCELALMDVGNDRALELTGKVPPQPGLCQK